MTRACKWAMWCFLFIHFFSWKSRRMNQPLLCLCVFVCLDVPNIQLKSQFEVALMMWRHIWLAKLLFQRPDLCTATVNARPVISWTSDLQRRQLEQQLNTLLVVQKRKKEREKHWSCQTSISIQTQRRQFTRGWFSVIASRSGVRVWCEFDDFNYTIFNPPGKYLFSHY